MVGDASGDLWTVVPNGAGTEQVVIRVGWSPAAFSTIASISPGYSSPDDLLHDSWQAVMLHGSMFLLDPPAKSPKDPNLLAGFSALYQISLTTGAVSSSAPTS
jgi:hypothetical protein